ncbi:heavy metal RND transporter [Lysobacter bugurensis]|uniref:Heavy metal RND transporter n=1 Tax=Cognatilysobacter bugurensis TaxID=543356 RepID=A0A918T366_9GAMM|nr:heavy metal RND transporter [Lysobacter bugurensis]
MCVSFALRRGRLATAPARAGLVFALSVFALFLPVHAAPGAAAQLSFEEAVALAGRGAPTLESRSANIDAAREEAARADELPDPQLMVGIENMPVSGSGAFRPNGDDMTMKKIGLMQSFPARAMREARQLIADRQLERAQALSAIEQLEVQEQAAQAWLATWAAQRETDSYAALREQAAVAVKVAKARLSAGTGSAVDAMAAQAAALEVENRVDAAQARLQAARASLARWLGLPSEQLPAVGAAPTLTELPFAEQVLLSTIDRQRELLDWRYREAIAEAEIALASADKRPDWSIAAAYGQRDGSRADMVMVEFRVGLPLFSRNRQDRAIAARRAQLASVVAEREDARRAQKEAIERALAEWRGLKQQVERKESQILPLARDRSETAVAVFGGGGPLQPWLEARRNELEIHVEHARHLGELGRVWAALAYLLPREETAR